MRRYTPFRGDIAHEFFRRDIAHEAEDMMGISICVETNHSVQVVSACARDIGRCGIAAGLFRRDLAHEAGDFFDEILHTKPKN